jgi:protoporphyrinogen oxidase
VRDPGRVLILGAGPTGLGAAYRLAELGVDRFTVLEARPWPGGLAASYVDEQGFTWDVGGHVQFSHYAYYDRVLDRALGDGWIEHGRESWIWLKGCWVPYPFQHNLHRLPPAERDRAMDGLERAARLARPGPAANLGEWIQATFGEGIAELFLRPYNAKVWGFPLETLGVAWIGERVATPDLERIRRSVREGRDDVAWGPNRTFRFPRSGGTGAIWRAVAALLDPDRLQLGTPVVALDLEDRRVRLADGRTVGYDHLVTSLPLDALCALAQGLPGEVRRAASALVHSAVHVLGVGLRGDCPATLRERAWIYFPEPHSPYYRVTVFSNYSPLNVPPGEGYWSLMAEVCETPAKPVDASRLRAWTLAAMRQDGLLGPRSEVVSFWHHREEYGYPTPFVGREAALSGILPALERHGVYSRGRFGAWKYEVSNQDHTFMQGVEAVDRVLGLGDEPTLRDPDLVNRGAFLRARPARGIPGGDAGPGQGPTTR